jgi:apolipoprotein N-acyltransferase
VLDNHVQATRDLAADVRAGREQQPDLVVWPENASDIDPFTNPEAYDAIDRAVEDIGVPVLVGAVLQGPGEKISNAGIVWDPVTGPGERYVKRHPVPFGEYIPYRSLAPAHHRARRPGPARLRRREPRRRHGRRSGAAG